MPSECKYEVLVLITVSIASVVLSTNVVVRRLNPNEAEPPLTDLFTNSQCSSSRTCPSRSFCAGGNCCMCQCMYDYPNFLANTTHSKCTNYGETNRITAANCKYSFRKPNEPLEVLSLTTNSTGKIKFQSERDRLTNCSEIEELSVDRWEFLDEDGHWVSGEGGLFSVEFKSVGGPNLRKNLTFLKWHARVDPKYRGLFIKISLNCSGVDIGCILAKINGTYEYVDSLLSTMPPGSSSVSLTEVPTESETSTNSSTVSPGSSGKATGNNKGFLSGSTVARVLFALGGLICLIFVVCLIVVLYRRRKRSSSEKPIKSTEIDSVKLDQSYQEPRYDAHTKNAGVDNPIYCDPEEQIIAKRSKMDPLPALPSSESIYQTLDESTRKDADYNLPATRPPVSCSHDDSQVESSEYLNPERESHSEPTDYENPPKNTEAYDNTPLMNNQEHESFTETSDYDNHPVQGKNRSPITNNYSENLNSNECSDYDNPDSTSSPEAVPASTQDTQMEQDYFELKPENSSL